jgi:hypothetical protein
MRSASFAVLVLGGVVLGSGWAHAADSGPVLVLPGRHGLPVIINGIDVTGAVLEGDWGLYSPHMVGPTVIIPPPAWSRRRGYPGGHYQGGYVQGGYFPAFGHEPAYGRDEIEPPADRRLPPPAPSFHRSWSSQSDPLPASLDPPTRSPPLLIAPQISPSGRRDDNTRTKKP